MDRALMRNTLAFDLYRTLTNEQEWAPRSTYVELTLDGAYMGVFQLEERVQHGGNRVPVPDDDGSGAHFIVKVA